MSDALMLGFQIVMRGEQAIAPKHAGEIWNVKLQGKESAFKFKQAKRDSDGSTRLPPGFYCYDSVWFRISEGKILMIDFKDVKKLMRAEVFNGI